MEAPERIWLLMSRSLTNEISVIEQEELFTYLSRHPLQQQQYELLKRAWQAESHNYDNLDEARAHITKIIDKANAEPEATVSISTRRIRRRNIYIAAAAIVVFAGAWLAYRVSGSSSSATHPQETLIAQKGSRTRSLLPDGSTVWLNAGSKLYFVNDFTNGTREVRLEGEAFFDIVKKPQQPFIVHTSGVDIKVLGTAFNVKAYPEDVNVETTLYRGLVQVSRPEDTTYKPIQLKPNEKLILTRYAPSGEIPVTNTASVETTVQGFRITHIDSTKKENERFETAWVYSRLEFRGDDFGQLALKMERWFNVSIRFEDEKVKRLSFNGSFENETPEQALASLKTAIGDFDYKISGNEISIRSSE